VLTILEPGTEFAGYVIERQAGAGGMSVLYLARDPVLDRPVALKVMAPDLSDDPAFRQRFEREAKAACLVLHGCTPDAEVVQRGDPGFRIARQPRSNSS
jgi:serine/threonine-protein kinase